MIILCYLNKKRDRIDNYNFLLNTYDYNLVLDANIKHNDRHLFKQLYGLEQKFIDKLIESNIYGN